MATTNTTQASSDQVETRSHLLTRSAEYALAARTLAKLLNMMRDAQASATVRQVAAEFAATGDRWLAEACGGDAPALNATRAQ